MLFLFANSRKNKVLVTKNKVVFDTTQMREEVDHMIGPIIKLPSMIEDELRAEIAEKEAELAGKDAEIQRLQELVNQLTTEKPVS